MAVYRIFPEKDTFIYTESSLANTGRDAILEIGGYNIATTANGQTRRTLIQFSTSEIRDVISNKVGSLAFTSSLNLYVANTGNIPIEYTVEAYPLAQAWDEGTGKVGDNPIDKTGCSWTYTKASETTDWTTSGFGTNITGSSTSAYPGGGSWYTGSSGNSMAFTQSFTKTTDHDISIDVRDAIVEYNAAFIPNYGFILKLSDELEFNLSSSLKLQYFSSDTNTIYPPYLEFKWDDFSYSTGSLQTVTTSEIDVNIRNRREKYINEGKNRFRLSVKDLYPTRTFTTSSIYSTNKLLPTASYWGLRDENTEEMVVDFDTLHTKISADSTSNYFDIYMNGLQPERYYRLLIKSEIDGSTNVIDGDMVFKVVRNG